MLLDVMDYCTLSDWGVHSSGKILCEVDLPKAIEFAKKLTFCSNHFAASRMGLGDHLVTIPTLEHPCGPTQWPLGPCGPGHRHPKSPENPKIAVI